MTTSIPIVWLALIAACSGPTERSERVPVTPRAPEPAEPAPEIADAGVAAIPDATLEEHEADNTGDMNRRRDGNRILGGTGRGTRSTNEARVGTGKGGIAPPDERVGADATTPGGRIAVASKLAVDESSLPVDAVVVKIQSSYMAGIKRCYKEHLKKDPAARGKMKLGFTVDESGRTINAKVAGFAKPIDDCFVALMGGWRFFVPKDKAGDPKQASFEINLNLVPD